MLDFSDYTAHQDTLVTLQNTLNTTQGELANFYEDADPAAGRDVLTTLREAASDLAALIEQLETQVEDAEAEQDAAR